MVLTKHLDDSKGLEMRIQVNLSIHFEFSDCMFDTAYVYYQDGHFENTYYSDFISNLNKIKYAGEFRVLQFR